MEGYKRSVGGRFNGMDYAIQSLESVPRGTIKVGPEDVLTRDEAELLARARGGELPCPRCGQPLYGEFMYFPLDDGDCYAGVKLSCLCGFVEY